MFVIREKLYAHPVYLPYYLAGNYIIRWESYCSSIPKLVFEIFCPLVTCWSNKLQWLTAPFFSVEYHGNYNPETRHMLRYRVSDV
jgi:hypothetical protein